MVPNTVAIILVWKTQILIVSMHVHVQACVHVCGVGSNFSAAPGHV